MNGSQKFIAPSPVYPDGGEPSGPSPISPTSQNFPLKATQITSSSTPQNLDPNVSFYKVTTSGSGGNEFLNLPGFPLTDGGITTPEHTGQFVIIALETQTNPSDVIIITCNDNFDGRILQFPTVTQLTNLYAYLEQIVINYVGGLVKLIWTSDGWQADEAATDYEDNTSWLPLTGTGNVFLGDDISDAIAGSNQKGTSVGLHAKNGDGSGNGGDVILSMGTGAANGNLIIENAVSVPGATVGTLTNAPHAGNPQTWLEVMINGVVHYIPAWHA